MPTSNRSRQLTVFGVLAILAAMLIAAAVVYQGGQSVRNSSWHVGQTFTPKSLGSSYIEVIVEERDFLVHAELERAKSSESALHEHRMEMLNRKYPTDPFFGMFPIGDNVEVRVLAVLDGGLKVVTETPHAGTIGWITWGELQKKELFQPASGDDIPKFDPNARQSEVKAPDLPVDIKLPDLPEMPKK